MFRLDPSEPHYGRGGRFRPVVGTAASKELRNLLKSHYDQYTMASEALQLQLALYKKAREQDLTKIHVTESEILGIRFGALKLNGALGDDTDGNVRAICIEAKASGANAGASAVVWNWYKLPYPIRCAGLIHTASESNGSSKRTPQTKKQKSAHSVDLYDDVDEWILHNEKYLRLLGKAGSGSWKEGLVKTKDFGTVFGASSLISDNGTPLALKVPRPELKSLAGYTTLTAKRAPAVYLQPTDSAFQANFQQLTGGILCGLDWKNVFVAGGLILGALLTPTLPASHPEASAVNQASSWASSDIDLYIYGLGPEDANAKIEHISEVYRKNLGSPGAPFLAVRNSQTITLYSEWPKRRVQIVLKLVKSPREVLLNFDLDICAVGWDGKELYMLPRCARALETGMNVFTMDLINGHYLGDRKETRDKRVFKYANKGYGLRILPMYIGFLSVYQSKDAAARQELARGEILPDAPLSLEAIAREAGKWTRTVVRKYIAAGQKDLPFYWPSGRYKRTPTSSGKPLFSHPMLETYAQISSEPLGRSCLTGFELFMRHVALWELENEGEIEIYDNLFALEAYDPIGDFSYDDTPTHSWDESFSIEDLKKSIDDFNNQETFAMEQSARQIDLYCPITVSRITYSDSIQDLLSEKHDIQILLILNKGFMNMANELIIDALMESCVDDGLPDPPLTKVADSKTYYYGYGENPPEDDALVVWRLDNILNWQLLDRRIDEVREMLWALHRSNERMQSEEDARTDVLRTQIGRRAIRMSEEDEVGAFIRWVGRQPYHENMRINGLMDLLEVGGSHDESFGTDDEDEEY